LGRYHISLRQKLSRPPKGRKKWEIKKRKPHNGWGGKDRAKRRVRPARLFEGGGGER